MKSNKILQNYSRKSKFYEIIKKQKEKFYFPPTLSVLCPEVFKTSYGKILKTRPSETMTKNLYLEVTWLNKVNFFNSQSKKFTK